MRPIFQNKTESIYEREYRAMRNMVVMAVVSLLILMFCVAYAHAAGRDFSALLTADEIKAFGSGAQANEDLEARVTDKVKYFARQRLEIALKDQTEAGLQAIEAVAVAEKAKAK